MLDPSRLEVALKTLGRLLSDSGLSYELVAIGGSGLLLLGLTVRPTRDLDIIALVEKGLYVRLQELPKPLLEASTELARTERVLLFRRLLPTGVPGVSAFELSIGDAAEALSEEEIGAYFRDLMATAGAQQAAALV